jgi:ribose transport system permease protein
VSVDGATADQALADDRTRAGKLTVAGLRLLNRYSFGFALVLSLVLLLLNLVQTDWNFGWQDQLANFAPLAIAAIASTPSIISGGGGFDLTISPLMYLVSAVFIVWLVPHGLGGAEAIPLVLLLSTGVGILNGLIIVGFRVQPVVATLSMYFVLLGVDLWVVPRPQTLGSSWVSDLAGSVGPVPGAVFTIGTPLLIWVVSGLIPYRQLLYAVGSNDATAFVSGINVDLVRVIAYALGGLFAGFGGIALVALVNSVNGGLGATYTLLAIASVALGGTSLWGGRGGVFGSMLGAASIYLLQNLLTISQISPSWLQVFYGGMLIFAVVLSGVATRVRMSA